MDAEEAMREIGAVLDGYFRGSVGPVEVIGRIAQIQGAYLMNEAGK